MGVHLHFEADTSVPVNENREWWFDLSPDDHDTEHFHHAWGPPNPKDSRTILSRDENTIKVRDVVMGGKMTLESTVRKVGDDRIVIDMDGDKMASRIEMTFEPSDKGTRVTLEGDVQAKGFMKLLMPLMKGKFSKMLDEDFHLHVADLEDDWKKEPW